MNPSSPPQNPGYLDQLMNFLFGRGQLNQAASPGGMQPQQPQMQPQGQPNQMQNIVNAYMQQKQAADAAASTKKKKKQPILDQ